MITPLAAGSWHIIPLIINTAVVRNRVGHHSTSDDSFAYRPRKEVEDRKRLDNPIVRFRLFLEARGWWTADEEAGLTKRLKADVVAAYKRAETLPRPEVREMFTEVYGGEEPWHLVSGISVEGTAKVSMLTCARMMQREQREELQRLVKKYGTTWEPWKAELKKHKGEGREWTEGP